LSLKDYVVKYEYNGTPPICSCGYCNDEPLFVRGKFLTIINEHKTFKWKQEQYIKKFGQPICKGCGKEIGFHRDKPLKYCSKTCLPNRWNQDKCKSSLKKNHGVDNPMELKFVREKVSIINKKLAIQALEKRRKTVKERYNVDSVMNLKSSKEKQKQTMLKKYGVDHISKTEKFKESARQRLFKKNPAFSINNIRTKKFKTTNLNYQSFYELDFLNLCESLNILNRINNGNVYKYSDNIHRLITDFSIDDYEIEIKSSWIMKKQGGIEKVFEKKYAVEKSGKKYIFILDKDYSEFMKLFT
jgi:glycerol-3-phosphate cytidylyltransferase-like family protein